MMSNVNPCHARAYDLRPEHFSVRLWEEEAGRSSVVHVQVDQPQVRVPACSRALAV